ncbi:hypothetical protein CTAYLR_005549 [Chrysophaeum taylorii]|uniref:FAD-binding domain-containing protein n=1 Tax=Chrysophaeum taylorii TaxID=2483200 RepID=A0AAD7UKM2_9STRA|nr:hypothetical protein CTAYLR_005549 [Chrysophaeum taylorii]
MRVSSINFFFASSYKIGIVGAGPAGLTLARALDSKHEVTVFDRGDPLKPGVGGGLQLTSGASLLKSRIGVDVSSVGLEIERVVSRSGTSVLLDLDVRGVLRKAGLGPGYAIMRESLQKLLAVPTQRGNLVNLEQDEHKVRLEFDSGTFAEDFDLVVGCDGVGSSVERILFGDTPPEYAGIRILLCVGDSSDTAASTFEQFFGRGAYCLRATYGAETSSEEVLAICYQRPRPTASQWSTNEGDAQDILARAGIDLEVGGKRRFYEASVFQRFPRFAWSKGRVILIGDAAHAMPPFLGQGANQAIADAVALADRLHLPYKQAFEDLHRRRFPLTTRLQLNSRVLGTIETQSSAFGCRFRDLFFQTTGTLGIAEQVFLDGARPRV